jgi:tRNA(Ile)-lysidine synthase
MKESTTNRFLKTIEDTLAAHGMTAQGEGVLVAVSGGPDSMALLHALGKLAPKKGLRLGVAHLNHGLRPGEAESDEALVHKAASSAKLPYFTEKADVPAVRKARGLSMEEAAREVRYRFLEEVARENLFSAIAVGHHADDNAELVLMNLLRGSGPLGLAGMPPQRPLSATGTDPHAPRLIRPLLGVNREDILAYAAENHIPYATDSTNTDPCYLRNRIRTELMPLLRQRYNPNIAHTLNRSAQILRSEKEWIDHLLAAELEDTEPSDPADAVSLLKSRMRDAHPAEARRLVRMAVEAAKGDLRQIGFGHIDAVLALAGQPGTGSLDLPDRIRVTAHPQRLVFKRESLPLRQVRPAFSREKAVFFEHVLGKPGIIFIPEIAATVRANVLPPDTQPDFRKAGHQAAFFDMKAVSFPLTVRSVKPGDRFTPLGMTGSQKVKKYFIDHKIPATRRACCPVLESGGRLVWLMGYRIDDSVKITAKTGQVLKVEFSLA